MKLLPVLLSFSFLHFGACDSFTTVSRSPVERVVKLLETLKANIEKDGKEENLSYDKYACWCDKTASRKANMIENGRQDIRRFGQAILVFKGETAVLASEIADLERKIETNKNEQQDATAVRRRENEKYTAETSEVKDALAALEKAVEVLVEGTSLLQSAQTSAEKAKMIERERSSIQKLLGSMPIRATGSASSKSVALLSDFVTTGAGDVQNYAPQSWTIQGILKDMYETFASDLETATGEEAGANRAFELFIHAKSEELEKLEKNKSEKEAKKTEAEANLAAATQNYDDAQQQLEADVAFFDSTKQACKSKSESWKTRSDLRAEEIRGIEEALSILTTDAARDLFGRSIKEGKETRTASKYESGIDIMTGKETSKYEPVLDAAPAEEAPALIQFESVSSFAALRSALNILKAKATATHSIRLAALAARVGAAKKGHFDEVIAAIDTMIEELKKENTDDIAKRDQCIDEFTKIESTVGNVKWLIRKNVARLDKLHLQKDQAEKSKAEAEQALSETRAEMKQLTQVREDEHRTFQQTQADDKEAIDLLLKARSALAAYYQNNSVSLGPIQGNVKDMSFMEKQPEFEVSKDQAPDAVFSASGARKGEAKSIVQIMTMLIEDVNDEIRNDMKTEELEQTEYENQMKDLKTLEADLEAKIDGLETEISRLIQSISDEDASKRNNEFDLKSELDYKKDIKPDCDWILGAFKQREQRREAEMAGLTGAKDFLVGAAEPSLLQGHRSKSVPRVTFLGIQG